MYDKLKDLPVEKISLFTKGYTMPRLIQYLKREYGDLHLIVVNQLLLQDKAKKKLPKWVEAGCLFTARSLEQCSSPALASFKSTLVSGEKLLDLSGGLGVDDVGFSKVFNEVVSVDADEELNALVHFNLQKLNIGNVIRQTDTAENYLENHITYTDVIYIDADRRGEGGKKSALLSGSSPDVQGLMPKLLKQSELVMLKLSPLIDISFLLKTFLNIKHIYVVGIQNEVKEVLVVLGHAYLSHKQNITAVQLGDSGEVIHCLNSEIIGSENVNGVDGAWFYEPSNMVIKAGLSQVLASNNGLQLLAKNSYYMTGSSHIKDYFGRVFKTKRTFPFSKSAVKTYLNAQGILKANVAERNFVSSVDELKKTFGLEDGGNDYLFFTTNVLGVKMFYHCVKP